MDELLHKQWVNMAESYTIVASEGGDPLREVTPLAQMVEPQVAIEFIPGQWAKRQAMRQELYKDPLIDLPVKLHDEHMDAFKVKNQAAMVKYREAMPPDERALWETQLERTEMPDETQQQLLNMLSYADGKLKEIDESMSVETDPTLGPIYRNMVRMAQTNTAPFELAAPTMQGSDIVSRSAAAFTRTAMESMGGMADFITQIGFFAVGGLDGDFYEEWRKTRAPNGAFVTKDGEVVHNGGHIPPDAAPYANLQLLMGKTIDEVRQQAYAYDEAFEWSQAQVKGAEVYVNGIASTIGFLSGFVGSGGGVALSQATKGVSMGVSRIAGLRQNAMLMTKGAANLLTAETQGTIKLAKVLSAVGGAGLGTAVWEMGVRGRVEGYGHAAIEGMKMGPLFAIAGWAGKRMEALLKGTGIPKWSKRVLEGMTEGFALSAADLADLNGAAWSFMRDPTNPDKAKDWSVGMLSAMVGFGIFKGITGTTPSDYADFKKSMKSKEMTKFVERVTKGSEQMQAAMFAKSEADVASVAEKMGVTPETVRKYGEALREQRDAGKSAELQQRLIELETQLELEEFALNLTPGERADARSAIRYKIAQLIEKGSEPEELQGWIDKLELLGEKPAPVARAARRKARTGRRRQTTLMTRLRKQGLGMVERPDGGFDLMTPEGRKLTPAQVRKRLREAQVDLVERPDGGYDIVDRKQVTKPAKPAEMGSRLKEQGLGLVERPDGSFDVVPDKDMTVEEVAKAMAKAGVGLIERPGRAVKERNTQVGELMKLPEVEQVKVFIERMLGPKGFASSAEAELAAAKEKLPETPGYDVVDLRPRGAEPKEAPKKVEVDPEAEKQLAVWEAAEGERPIRRTDPSEEVQVLIDKVLSTYMQFPDKPVLPDDLDSQILGELIVNLHRSPDSPRAIEWLMAAVPSLRGNYPDASRIVSVALRHLSPIQYPGGPISREGARTIEQQASALMGRFKELFQNSFGQRIHPEEKWMHDLLRDHLAGKSLEVARKLKETGWIDELDAEVIRQMLFKAAGEDPRGEVLARPMAEGEATGPEGGPLGPGMPGQPKSLQLDPSHQVEPHPALGELQKKWGPRVIQPDILTRMEGFKGDPIRAAIRKGMGDASARAKKWLGVYKPRENLIRTDDMRNAAINAHEFAHAMEQAAIDAGIWGPHQMEPWMAAEFAKIAGTYPDYANLKPKAQIEEGWAEFWARWQLGDPRLYTESPRLHDWMMKWLISPEAQAKGFTEQVTEVEELQRYWRLMGASERASSIWQKPGEPLTMMEIRGREGWIEKFTTGFTKYIVDDIVELRKAERKWYEQAGINADNLVISLRPSSLIDAFRMTAAQQAQQMWKEGTHDLAGNRTGEGAQELLDHIDSLGELNNFIDYVLAKRAVNKIDQGYRMPGSREDFMFQVEKYESSNPEFYEYAERMRDFSKRVLNYAVEGGLFTEEQVQNMLDTDPIYLPFARIIKFGGKRVSGARGVAERGVGVTPMRGGPEQLSDPIDALKAQVQNVITKTQQNVVMRSMYLNHKMLRGLGGFVTEVSRDVQPQEVLVERMEAELKRLAGKVGKKAEMAQLMKDLKEILGGENPEQTALTFWFQKAVPSGATPIIAFTPRFTKAEIARLKMEKLPSTKGKFKNLAEEVRAEDGKLRWYEVDADAYNALMGVDSGQMLMEHWPGILRGLALGPTTLVRWGATLLNPSFVVRNLIRDPLSRQLFTQSETKKDRAFMGFGALVGGWMARLKNKYSEGGVEGVKIFDALGLGGATRTGVDIAREEQEGVFHSSFVRPLRAIADFIGSPEKWLRTTEFIEIRERLLKEGKSDFDANMEAALAAKEVTVNFTRAGIMGRMLTQIYPYFNPRVQGLKKFWGSALGFHGKDARNQALVRGIANMGGLTALSWWLAKDTDWYKDLPLWRRVNFWTFDMSWLTGSDTPDLMTVPKPFEAGIAFGTSIEAALTAFNDFDEALAEDMVWELVKQHAVGWPFIPSVVLPYVESGLWNADTTGYSFFFERPIVPDWQIKSRVPEDQFNAYTTQTARWIGDALGFSPSKIEHFLSQQLGGLPRRVVQAVEQGAGFSNVAMTANTIPFFGTLFSQRPHQFGRAEDTVHDIEYQLGQLSGSDRITGRGRAFRSQINAARERIRATRLRQRRGYISADKANERTFDIAYRLAERWERMKESDYRREPRSRR